MYLEVFESESTTSTNIFILSNRYTTFIYLSYTSSGLRILLIRFPTILSNGKLHALAY